MARSERRTTGTHVVRKTPPPPPKPKGKADPFGGNTVVADPFGASTALAQEAHDTDTNPAAAVFVPRGYSAALALFSPDRQYTISGNPSGAPGTFGLTPGTVTSKSKFFPMPSLGMNFRPSEIVAALREGRFAPGRPARSG